MSHPASLAPVSSATDAAQVMATDYANALREDGLIKGTRVLTDRGWVPVERLVPGDKVATFDNDLQTISNIHTTQIKGHSLPPQKAFVMHVPAGALGDHEAFRLLANQEVLIESDEAEAEIGDPFVLFPAVLLSGYQGIGRDKIDGDLDVFMLTFRDEQIVQVEGGALVACRAEADFSPFDAAGKAQDYVGYPRLEQTHLQCLAIAILAEQGRATIAAQPLVTA